jgi:uncharacterized protein YjiS (DUF1127 family)
MHGTTIQTATWATGGAHSLLRAVRRRWRERRMAAALHALNDATLKDIGVYRGEIPSIARARRAEPGWL